MTCTAAVIAGVAVGMIAAAILIAVVLWAAAKLSGQHAEAERSSDEE